MNSNQRNQLDMHLVIRNFVAQNEAAARQIPRFWDSYVILKSTTDEIQVIGQAQGINKTGIASDKNKIKKKLIALAAKYSRKIAAFAKFIKSDTILNEVKYNEGQLERFSEVTLIEKALIIHSNIEANIGSLAEHGITAETQKEFLDTINSLNNILQTPRATIAERKKATERLAVLFKTADDTLELMDYAVSSMKEEQIDFYNAYKMSRKIVDSKTGKIALKGLAIDLATKTPLRGVKFVFKIDGGILPASGSNGKITKTTAAKGGFHIRNMQPGTYKVIADKPGYKAKEVLVSISGGERSDLTVEMEKV